MRIAVPRACSRRRCGRSRRVIEDRGIDEIYIDLTGVRLPEHEGEPEDEVDAWWRARDVAKALKDAVRDATGLTCSIAVAPNKLLAKIASELDKPDGLTILRPDDVATRIWPLPPRKINGIGPKASEKLDALGVTHHRTARARRSRVAHRALRPQLRRVALPRGAGRGRSRGRHRERARVDQPRDDVRSRPVRAARPRRALGDLHRPVRAPRGRPRAQGLRGPHDRHQAALRQLQDGDPRPHARDRDAGRAGHPPRRGRVPEARAARAAHPAPRRAHRVAVAAQRAYNGRTRSAVRAATAERGPGGNPDHDRGDVAPTAPGGYTVPFARSRPRAER